VRVLAERVFLVRLDVQDALGLVEMALHLARPGAVEPEVALPLLEHARWRAPRHAAVDDGRPADAAPLGEDDRWPAEDHGRARVAVEAPDRRRGIGREGVDAVEAAFLQHEHVAPGRAEARRGGRARARADDHDVGVERVPPRALPSVTFV
jgi:hypothetical protein